MRLTTPPDVLLACLFAMAVGLKSRSPSWGSIRLLTSSYRNLLPRLVGARTCASHPDLKTTLRGIIPAKRELLNKIKTHDDKVIGEIKISNVIGGMRGLKSLVWEGSVLDADEGIRFHGFTIKDCQSQLPQITSGAEMTPEAMFWLLLTGQIPSHQQSRDFSKSLAKQGNLPPYVLKMLDNLPQDTHPMTQFAMAVSALNRESEFAKAYAKGLDKADYWEPVFDDCISLLAKLPSIAAKIYQNTCARRGPLPADIEPSRDWAHNFAAMLGKGHAENTDFHNLLRLYLSLHGDHEGGNVSAHTTHLVGSALSDPYLSYSAGLLGLAGPLHGLAAQEVLSWIIKMQENLVDGYTEKDIEEYIWLTLKSGRVIPGFGHAVLRKPDPRFEALMHFARARPQIAQNPLFRLVEMNSRVAPEVLKKHGKTKNPYPNVDAVSGALFHHFGFNHSLYYTVTFGVSRGLGPLAQLIWDRILGFPIERPKSINLEGLLHLATGQST